MKIAIFQPMLKQYRMPLFDRMGKLLAEQGHELRVACGSPPPSELIKGDNILINTNYCVVEKSWWLFDDKLHFMQHAARHIGWADFVITEQANKHFHNHMLIIFRTTHFKKFAYWGHGKNRQGNPNSLKEKLKKGLAKHCDWWFAYTKGVGNYMIELGYPAQKITVLNNSIDISDFKRLLAQPSTDDTHQFNRQLGIADNARIGLYCGALYSNKKIGFLLNAASIIHSQNPDFVLLMIGSGADSELVKNFAQRHSFIKYLGPLFGGQKALAFKSAEIFLCPGATGLAILDAFSAGLPFFSSDDPNHGPEIDYLQHGINGVMTVSVEEDYANAVINVLEKPEELTRLQQNALASSNQFSIDNMAQNFVDGIQAYFKSQDKQ
jgi:L-malate glycosyltransferase